MVLQPTVCLITSYKLAAVCFDATVQRFTLSAFGLLRQHICRYLHQIIIVFRPSLGNLALLD